MIDTKKMADELATSLENKWWRWKDHEITELVAARELRRLTAENEALKKDAERLDSGCIMTSERNEFGEEYMCERRGMNLRAAIDAAIRASKGEA